MPFSKPASSFSSIVSLDLAFAMDYLLHYFWHEIWEILGRVYFHLLHTYETQIAHLDISQVTARLHTAKEGWKC